MNNTTSQWPQTDLTTLPDDDFSAFLDFDSIDFPFLDTTNTGGTPLGSQDVNTDMPDAPAFLDSNMLDEDPSARLRQSQHQYYQHQQVFDPSDGCSNPYAFNTPQSYELQQTSTFSALPNLSYLPQGAVPPTPNSSVINPEAYRYLQQNDPQSSHRWAPYQLRKDDEMGLNTPLVSPDVPPNDISYPYFHDFSLNQPYSLSPLTSPAIHPQSNTQRTPLVHSHTADSSLTASPIDLNFSFPQEGPSVVNERLKRTRRKIQTSRANSRGRSVAIASNGRRRNSLSVSIPTQDSISTIPEGVAMSATADSRIHSRRQSLSDHQDYSSSSKSISPQPSAEASMAPPPRPASNYRAPAGMLPKSQLPVQIQPFPTSIQPPATPASMMRLLQLQGNGSPNQFSPLLSPSVQGTPTFTANMRTTLEDLHLPDAAVPHTSDGQSTPRPVKVLPTCRRTLTPAASAHTSPAVGPMGSPNIVANTPKLDAKGGRNSRKRLSAATALMSPAIRPKMSPSIKPLLPEGANLNTEAHAILLASKSNYQNIIEGNHLPGVTYPSELTINLSSKRTSHKLAEQGRRNRINIALQELQTLLPPVIASPTTTTKDDADMSLANSPTSPAQDATDHQQPNGSRTPALTAQQSNSKAATVELAIDHIKQLKGQMADRDAENELLRREMRELREALKRATVGSSTPSKSGTEASGSNRSTPSKEESMQIDRDGGNGDVCVDREELIEGVAICEASSPVEGAKA